MQFRLVSSDWPGEIDGALASGPGEIRIVCPFIKLSSIQRPMAGAHRRKIDVVTRFDLKAFYQGVSDITALEWVIQNGGCVKGIKGLHSKLFVFGSSHVIAGSANLTEAAMRTNQEFGFTSSERGIIAECRRYFDTLWEAAGQAVSLEKLAEWNRTVQSARRTHPRNEPSLPDYGTRLDASVNRSPFVEDLPALPSDMRYFVKFFGSGSERSLATNSIRDDVIEGERHRICTYGRPTRRVRDGDVMFMARVMRNPNDYRIFGQGMALAHRSGVDEVTEAELAEHPRCRRWPYYVRVYDTRFINGVLGDGISLKDLMERFEWRAFASTYRNRLDGKGRNENPRLSLSQQPQIELTPVAAAWLSESMNRAYLQHGTLDISGPDYS